MTKRLHERRWTHDRTGWGVRVSPRATTPTSWSTPGAPWHTEPDKVQWLDADTSYACLAVRNHFGAWCGYVGVPPGHPCHGVEYPAVPVEVHGGLTYSDSCNDNAPEGHGICHIPEPGQPADVWWLGFDCGHYLDLQPRMPVFPDLGPCTHETYRTLAYVQKQCEQLATQLRAIATMDWEKVYAHLEKDE